MFKLEDERRTAGSGTKAADAGGDPAVGGGVCEQRYAAERVLPESRVEFQHAGSPSEEAAVEEADEERSRRRQVGGGGVGHRETAG